MISAPFRILILLLSVFLSACSEKPSFSLIAEKERPSENSPLEKIVSGTPVSRQDQTLTKGIVALTLDGSPGVHCTGILIDSRWVLTAAHCVWANGAYLEIKSLRVHFIENILNSKSTHQRQVSQLIKHPDFVETEDPCFFGPCEEQDLFLDYLPNDLALIQLSQPAPHDARVQTLATAQSIITEKTKVQSFGFGTNQPLDRAASNANGILLKQESQLQFSPFGQRLNTDFKVLLFENSKTQAICHGDSGGPLFYKNETNQWILLGTTSHPGGQNKLYPCHAQWTVFTDLRQHLLWIRATLKGRKL